MNEHEAADLVANGPGFPRPEPRDGVSQYGGCPQCFRGDYWEPPAMCGDCEDAAMEASQREEHRLYQQELDDAFHEMVDDLERPR